MDLGGKAMLSKTSRLANESGLLILLFLFFVFLSGGKKSQADSPQEENKVKVFVSIAPQAFFLERVGGSHVEVGILVSPGQSPHTYEPSPREASALARATVFFTIGMPFEKMLIEKILSSLRNPQTIIQQKNGVYIMNITQLKKQIQQKERRIQARKTAIHQEIQQLKNKVASPTGLFTAFLAGFILTYLLSSLLSREKIF